MASGGPLVIPVHLPSVRYVHFATLTLDLTFQLPKSSVFHSVLLNLRVSVLFATSGSLSLMRAFSGSSRIQLDVFYPVRMVCKLLSPWTTAIHHLDTDDDVEAFYSSGVRSHLFADDKQVYASTGLRRYILEILPPPLPGYSLGDYPLVRYGQEYEFVPAFKKPRLMGLYTSGVARIWRLLGEAMDTTGDFREVPSGVHGQSP